jgi:CTP:molybdopterin cytidylyltransferase MocA
MESTVRIWAIVPAAGAGRRMGRAKQTLPYRGSTLTAAVVRTLLNAGVEGVVVVTRTSLVDALDLPTDRRLQIAANDDASSEMIDSIRIGLSALAGDKPAGAQASTADGCTAPSPADGVLVVPGDMPDVASDAFCRCIDAYLADPCRIVIATHQGHRAHPIVFPFSMRSAIDRLDRGLNDLARQYPEMVRLIDIEDPAVTRDVDTAADYDDLLGSTPDGQTKPS